MTVPVVNMSPVVAVVVVVRLRRPARLFIAGHALWPLHPPLRPMMAGKVMQITCTLRRSSTFWPFRCGQTYSAIDDIVFCVPVHVFCVVVVWFRESIRFSRRFSLSQILLVSYLYCSPFGDFYSFLLI